MAETKKSAQIGGRIPAALRDRVDGLYERYGVTPSQALEDALTALCDCVEATGKYDRRMVMVFDEQTGMAAEAKASPPRSKDRPA